MKKTFYIEFYDGYLNGYVGYDNEPCNSLDNAMTFDTEEEAVKECKKLQKSWKSDLKVACVE